MKVHMVNQNKPKLPRPHSGFGPWFVIGVLLGVGSMYMLASAVKAEPVEQCSITGAVEDNLMSPERAEFMVCCEHGEEFTEMDMQ